MDVANGVQGLFVAVSIARWFYCTVSYHGTKPRALGKVCAVYGCSHWTETTWWHSNSALRWICWSCSSTETSFTSTPCRACRKLFFMEPIFFMESIFIPMDNPQDTCKGWEWWEWRGMAMKIPINFHDTEWRARSTMDHWYWKLFSLSCRPKSIWVASQNVLVVKS